MLDSQCLSEEVNPVHALDGVDGSLVIFELYECVESLQGHLFDGSILSEGINDIRLANFAVDPGDVNLSEGLWVHISPIPSFLPFLGSVGSLALWTLISLTP